MSDDVKVIMCNAVGICELCLDGVGEECHVPGCIFIRRDVPFPGLRDLVNTESGDLLSEVEKLRVENGSLDLQLIAARSSYDIACHHEQYWTGIFEACTEEPNSPKHAVEIVKAMRAENKRLRQLIEMPSLGLPKEMFSQGPEAD